jgi:hypothetical protein
MDARAQRRSPRAPNSPFQPARNRPRHATPAARDLPAGHGRPAPPPRAIPHPPSPTHRHHPSMPPFAQPPRSERRSIPRPTAVRDLVGPGGRRLKREELRRRGSRAAVDNRPRRDARSNIGRRLPRHTRHPQFIQPTAAAQGKGRGYGTGAVLLAESVTLMTRLNGVHVNRQTSLGRLVSGSRAATLRTGDVATPGAVCSVANRP